MTTGTLKPKSLAVIDQRMAEAAEFVERHHDYLFEVFDKLDRAVETGVPGDLTQQDWENLRMLASVGVQAAVLSLHERRAT